VTEEDLETTEGEEVDSKKFISLALGAGGMGGEGQGERESLDLIWVDKVC